MNSIPSVVVGMWHSRLGCVERSVRILTGGLVLRSEGSLLRRVAGACATHGLSFGTPTVTEGIP